MRLCVPAFLMGVILVANDSITHDERAALMKIVACVLARVGGRITLSPAELEAAHTKRVGVFDGHSGSLIVRTLDVEQSDV